MAVRELAGRLEGPVHVLPLRVYYEDTDFTGVVYHANYLKFCERGRSDHLRLLGLHHGEHSGRLSFMVRRMNCEFLKPAAIDDVLEVVTRFGEFAGARLELEQVIRRGDERLFEARVTLALVDARGKPRRIPVELANQFLSRVESSN